MKPRRTLAQMASEHEERKTIAGRPADVCPYCGAAMFVDGVNRTPHDIVRYVECRNAKCGRRFVTRQPPARLVRELGDEDNSAGGNPTLTLTLKYA